MTSSCLRKKTTPRWDTVAFICQSQGACERTRDGRRTGNGKIADEFIGVGCPQEVGQVDVDIFPPNDWRDVEVLELVESATELERLLVAYKALREWLLIVARLLNIRLFRLRYFFYFFLDNHLALPDIHGNWGRGSLNRRRRHCGVNMW